MVFLKSTIIESLCHELGYLRVVCVVLSYDYIQCNNFTTLSHGTDRGYYIIGQT